MTGAPSIARLRNIAARLIERGDVDAEWFAACLAEYDSSARNGTSLGDAFGFRLTQGQSAWWEIEALARRHEILRGIAVKYFPGSRRAAAAGIIREARRYEAGAWRQHRALRSPPADLVGTLRASLFALLKTGGKISEGIIRDVLAREMPVLTGHASSNATPAATEAPTDGSHRVQESQRSGGSQHSPARHEPEISR